MSKLLLLFCVFFALPALAAEEIAAPAEQSAQSTQSVQSYIFNLTYEDAEDAVSKALTEKAEGKIVSATINGKKAAPLYSYNKPISVEVRGLRPDSSNNKWSASLVVLSDGAVISAMPLAGRYAMMTEVPMLKHAVKNGEMISKNDIEVKQIAQTRVFKDTITDMASLIGQSPVRSISPARPIRLSEISAPSIVKKNALVKMRYKTPSMEITTAGQAMSDGAKGDVIEVKNTSSKKTARGVVSDANTVDILAQGV